MNQDNKNTQDIVVDYAIEVGEQILAVMNALITRLPDNLRDLSIEDIRSIAISGIIESNRRLK